jgi:hypothetical protein
MNPAITRRITRREPRRGAGRVTPIAALGSLVVFTMGFENFRRDLGEVDQRLQIEIPSGCGKVSPGWGMKIHLQKRHAPVEFR